jgi:hypothetical protein
VLPDLILVLLDVVRDVPYVQEGGLRSTCRDPEEIRCLAGVYVRNGVMCVDPFGDVPVAVAAAESPESAGQWNSCVSDAGELANSDAETGCDQFNDPHGDVEESEDGDGDAPPSLGDSSSNEDQGAGSEVDSDGSLGTLALMRRNLCEVVDTARHKLTRKSDARRCVAKQDAEGEKRVDLKVIPSGSANWSPWAMFS